MFELVINPLGHLIVREAAAGSVAGELPRGLGAAYANGAIAGMLASAADHGDDPLPPAFGFVRSLGDLYLTHLCKAATGLAGEAIDPLPPPAAELGLLMAQAPPMPGLEYLTSEGLAVWWSDLDALTRGAISSHPGGAQAYLAARNPRWRFVGRVTLHLAENKRDPELPFGFLATFANGLNAQGKVRHEPLGSALRQYSGDGDRAAMLNLLLPISRAAETVPFMRELVDSGHIYQPLAWSARQAHDFLVSIPRLEAAGCIVRVPDWWSSQRPSRPLVSVKVDTRDAPRLGAETLLEFSVSLSLNGETISRAEMDELLASSGGLVPLKGKWVEVDREKLRQALDHWKSVEKSNRKGGLTFFEGMRLLSGVNLGAREGLELEESVRAWTGLVPGKGLEAVLRELRSPESSAGKAPAGLAAQLRPYQLAGYFWLRFATRLGLGACLADDMGLGKTVQVIALLLDRKIQDKKQPAIAKNRQPSLLVVPASLIANWKAELARFAPGLSLVVAHPSEQAQGGAPLGAKEAAGLDLVITTYGMLPRLDWMAKYSWDLVILDEAQAIRNSGTVQARAAKVLSARSRVAMTGTPVENRLSDLWSLFDFLNPGLLGTAKEFGSFVKQLQSGDAPSFEPLRSLVRPYILRRLKTDKRVIADLPEKTEVKAYCGLSKHQAALYQKAVEELEEQLDSADGIQRRGIVLAQLMRLKQICNHPAQATGSQDYLPDRSGKFGRLAEIVEEIASRQEKLLVFTQFREITGALAEFLAGCFGQHGLVLHGGTGIKQRQELVNRFQGEQGPPFFVLSLKAGGTGLNLTAASHVIHFDRWWNPAIENQATDRAFRIGQKRNVLVHKFICRGTVEERIDEMIQQKSRLAGEVVGEGQGAEALLTEMDNDTLLRFVRLDLSRARDG